MHTPGPWALSERPLPIVSKGVHIKCSDGSSIAVLGYSSDQCKANAKLIATAPDLIWACEAALNYITGESDTTPEELEQWLRSTIQKAKGA